MTQFRGQMRVSRYNLRHCGVAAHKFGRETRGFAGVEIQAEVFDFGIGNALAIGKTQDFEAARAAQPPVAGNEPSRKQQFIADHRGFQVVNARMPHRHTAPEREAILQRHA